MVSYMYPKPSVAVSGNSGAEQLGKRRDKDNDAVSRIRGFVFESDPMDIARESTQPLQELGRVAASQGQYERTPAHLKTQMKKDFAVTSESVFILSTDGKTYLEPVALRGVPVERIDESSPYWEKSWASLETLLEAEEESQQKKQYYSQVKASKVAGDAQKHKQGKQAQDDCSKYTKIREIFGNGNGKYHPNQLVAKHHLPPNGLCEKELLYKMALKISNLRDLFKTNQLAMDPYDFYRWAICRNLRSDLLQALTSTRKSLKSIIRTMGDDSGTSAHNDEVFRTTVLYWASLNNKSKTFGKRARATYSRAGNKSSVQSNNPNRVGKARATYSRAGNKSSVQSNNLKRVGKARATPPRAPNESSVQPNYGISTIKDGRELAHQFSNINIQKRQPRQRKDQVDAAIEVIRYAGVNALRATQGLTIDKTK